jgi:hypothetical protein
MLLDLLIVVQKQRIPCQAAGAGYGIAVHM